MKLATATCVVTISLISFSLPSLSAPDKQFDSFWTKFKAAIQKNDKNAIADMTKLPYMDGSKTLNRQQFMQQCPKIFTASVRKCLQSGKPVKDKDSYMFFCGEEIFIFTKSGKSYVFTEIGVND